MEDCKPRSDKKKKKSNGKRVEKPKSEYRKAMVNMKNRNRQPDMMMLDSGTSSHMTPKSEGINVKKSCNVSILLADDSTVTATEKGTRSVKWKTENEPMQVNLSEIFIAPDMADSLLSVPELVKKNISVIFKPQRALLIDLENQ